MLQRFFLNLSSSLSRILPTLWKVELPFSLVGSMEPIFDPLNDCLYISDGWGTPFPSIRLRRISLTNGSEMASGRLRDGAGCLCFSPDGKSIIVVLGKRLIEFDRSNLNVINKWSNGVPRYCFYVNMFGRILLLMNWARPMLNLYDLRSSTCSKKRVGPCKGIFRFNHHEFLICSGKGGGIWLYSFEGSNLRRLIDTPQFIRAKYLGASSQLVLSLGNPYEITKREVVHYSDSRLIRIYHLGHDPGEGVSYQEYRAPTRFGLFETNTDATIFYLSKRTAVETYALEERGFTRLLSGRLGSGFEVLSIVPERSMVIAVSHRKGKSTLAAAKL